MALRQVTESELVESSTCPDSRCVAGLEPKGLAERRPTAESKRLAKQDAGHTLDMAPQRQPNAPERSVPTGNGGMQIESRSGSWIRSKRWRIELATT